MSFYHVYNRGCNRELLFVKPDNYVYLLRKIKTYLPDYPISILAYCLMPNHYHFLLEAETNTDTSPFIQRVFNGYVQAFNKQQHRSGTLFEGRSKTTLVDSEAYVLQLCRYIHLNPVKAKLVTNPEDWPYSNYREWIGERNGTLKDEMFIHEYFPTPEDYRRFVVDYQSEQRKINLAKVRKPSQGWPPKACQWKLTHIYRTPGNCRTSAASHQGTRARSWRSTTS